MRFFVRLTLVLSVLLTTFACSPTNTALPVYPPYRFTEQEKITLDIGKVEIKEEYQSPLTAPNVEHRFPIPPAAAIKSWVNDRIAVKGASRTLRITIRNASVVERLLPRTKGIAGVFTKDQAVEYDAAVEVIFEVFDKDPLFSQAEAKVAISRSHSMPEDVSLQEREQGFYSFAKQLMEDFNRQADQAIRTYLYQYRI